MPTTVSNNMIAFNGGSFVFRNKIINGDMLIAQRGTTFSTTVSSQYTVDRWNVTTEVPARPGRGDVTQSNDVPDNNEFQNSLRFTTTIPSNANTQFLEFKHYIEGYDARDLINQPIIISFWVKTNKPGIYCLALGNEGNGVTSDRSYVTEYRINTTNWEKKTIHIPSIDISSGTWNWTNGRGLKIAFTLAGANNAAPTLNAWINGEFETSNNQENLLDNAGNFFNITGVQLERGPTPTPFEHRPFGTELALCQRYFYRLGQPRSGILNIRYIQMVAGTVDLNQLTINYKFPVSMKPGPIITTLGYTYDVNNNLRSDWANLVGVSSPESLVWLLYNTTGAGGINFVAGKQYWMDGFTVSAEL